MTFAVIVGIAAATHAHDLFLKLDNYFLAPNSKAVVRVMNGTFHQSDGAVARERLAQLNVYGPQMAVAAVDFGTWRTEGKTSLLEFQTGSAGTYVVAVSTKPREIDLKASNFNEYLEHDGIPDTLEQRRKHNELAKDVRERYSKHVRALFQVGDRLSSDYKRPLNYPLEIIPQQNPYALKAGDTLSVLCLHNAGPIRNQLVVAGYESGSGRTDSSWTRTNSQGVARFKIAAAGKWYVKFIYMTRLEDPKVNYESQWASLTFAIR